jgi:Cu/Ag efflux protein CusF
MMKRTKGALIAGTAVLAMAGVGGGIAFAANSSTPTTTTPSAPAPQQHKARGLVGRVEHGQITVRTKTGDQALDIQRGQVTSVGATSVTVRSTDGFTATYAVSGTSTVRVQKKTSTIADVHNGDQVAVAALHTGNTDTIRRIADAGPAK